MEQSQSGAVRPQLPEPGPVGRVLLWIIRGLVAAMILSIIGVLAFGKRLLLWVAAGCLVLSLVIGRIFHVVRLSGK